MTQAIRSLVTLIVAVLAWTGLASQASAHPHVFVVAKSQLVFAPDGTITGVRHAWTFDDMFSTYATQGLESKTKGVFTREELQPLAQTNVESLKEFAYFTFAKQDGKKWRFGEPVDYYLEQDKEGALTLHFLLPVRMPVKVGDLSLEVYDPEYFIEFSLAQSDPITLAGAPASCKLGVERPSEASATQKRLSEDNFANGDTSNYGAMYANKIRVTCP